MNDKIYIMHKRRCKIVVKYYQRLKDLRNDNDLKQESIAIMLKTTIQQYSRYERGERELPMHHFITLARFYNVSLYYLAGLTDIPKTIDGKPYMPKPRKQG